MPATTPMETILISSIILPRTVTFVPASPEYFKYLHKHSEVFMLLCKLQVTPGSKILLQKLVTKFPLFYGHEGPLLYL